MSASSGTVVVSRSGTAQALGAAMVVGAAVAFVSAALDGVDALLAYAAPAILFGLLGWAAFWAPGVEISDGGVRIRNTLRTIEVPWPAIEDVDGRYGLQLRTAYGRFTAWGASAPSGRRRLRDATSAAAKEVLCRLEVLRAAGHLDNPRLEWSQPRVTWHTWLLVAIAVLVVASVGLPFLV
jgi:hypothetical protein